MTNEHRLGKSIQQLHVEKLQKELSRISLSLNEISVLSYRFSLGRDDLSRCMRETTSYLHERQRIANAELSRAQIDALKREEERQSTCEEREQKVQTNEERRQKLLERAHAELAVRYSSLTKTEE